MSAVKKCGRVKRLLITNCNVKNLHDGRSDKTIQQNHNPIALEVRKQYMKRMIKQKEMQQANVGQMFFPNLLRHQHNEF